MRSNATALGMFGRPSQDGQFAVGTWGSDRSCDAWGWFNSPALGDGNCQVQGKLLGSLAAFAGSKSSDLQSPQRWFLRDSLGKFRWRFKDAASFVGLRCWSRRAQWRWCHSPAPSSSGWTFGSGGGLAKCRRGERSHEWHRGNTSTPGSRGRTSSYRWAVDPVGCQQRFGRRRWQNSFAGCSSPWQLKGWGFNIFQHAYINIHSLEISQSWYIDMFTYVDMVSKPSKLP